MSRVLPDPGLQPERTELAWRRTTLSLVVGAVVALRLLPPVLGAWSLGLGFGALAFSGLVRHLARRRARTTAAALRAGAVPRTGGWLMLLLALATSAGAALGLVYAASR